MEFRVLPESANGSTPLETNASPNDHHLPSSSKTQDDGCANGGAILRQNHVGFVMLHGVRIVSLHIDGKERLCLAQISNTLLKDFSYNEIHNRRVALGITCVQCTPVQLEILRRAGAMPVSSRRCGMITKREAERLVRSFLEDNTPPRLPENFCFDVHHECGWGCRGSFTPSRYNSSRAKCIKCSYCGMFFSPNKFIFHCHRTPNAKYVHPDAANFNSWRRHLKLINKTGLCDLDYAWEDVKAMFNGGSRKRVLPSQNRNSGGQSERPQKQPHLSEHSLETNSTKVSYPFPVLPTPSPYVPFPTHMMNPRAPPHPAFPFTPSSSAPYRALSGPDNGAEQGQMRDFLKDKYAPFFYHYNSMWAKSLGLTPAMMEQYVNIAKMNDRMDTSFSSPNFQQMFQQLEDRRVEREINLGRIEMKKKAEGSKVSRSEAPLKTNTTRQDDFRHISAFKPIGKEANFLSGFPKSNYKSKTPLDQESMGDNSHLNIYDSDKDDVEVDVCSDDSTQPGVLSPAPSSRSKICSSHHLRNDKPLNLRVSASHGEPHEEPSAPAAASVTMTSDTGEVSQTFQDSLTVESKGCSEETEGKEESDENANNTSSLPVNERNIDITALDKMSKDELQRELLRLMHARTKSEELGQKGGSSG
ncbi:SKI family transcriptional corepressor 1 homolog-B [Lingula anatina]|uniref:SKI family transcriptional corepressor 1 homolog-B n=1 Tax=Lingula anatina TaxID=7574 RepID=A0A1S3K7F1_LINAN|nr:SKI family transcriptional corepressor 1 homolog-B [Lingula anatina]XP_013418422.1 SKI family transcriptional corepressor 1 homolog-B [Lingula anatina]|eukprot:XP_013418421.1 SKI family transcriptional corepressor 1 homolog-B [Lingula anatina]